MKTIELLKIMICLIDKELYEYLNHDMLLDKYHDRLKKIIDSVLDMSSIEAWAPNIYAMCRSREIHELFRDLNRLFGKITSKNLADQIYMNYVNNCVTNIVRSVFDNEIFLNHLIENFSMVTNNHHNTDSNHSFFVCILCGTHRADDNAMFYYSDCCKTINKKILYVDVNIYELLIKQLAK